MAKQNLFLMLSTLIFGNKQLTPRNRINCLLVTKFCYSIAEEAHD